MLCYMHEMMEIFLYIAMFLLDTWQKQRTPPSNPRVGHEANMTVITKRAVVLIGKKIFLQMCATHTKLTKRKQWDGQ